MNTEHPTFTKWLAGLPLAAAGARLPADSPYWDAKKQIEYARDFWKENSSNQRKFLFLARIPNLLFCALMGAFIFLLGREIYGEKAGLFAMFLFAFEPNFIAHASLANSDAPLGLTVAACIYFALKFLKSLKHIDFVFLLVFSSIAILIKYSGLFVLPLLIFLYIYLLRNYPTQYQIPRTLLGIKLPFKSRGARGAAFILIMSLWFFLAGLFAVLLSYGFKLTVITPENSPNFEYICDVRIPDGFPLREQLIDFAQKIPLPKEYIMGLYQVFQHNDVGHPSFLLGKYALHGWWYYFPVVFFFKTPIALMALILLSVVFAYRKDREIWISESVLVIPILIYAATAILGSINLGVRHLLFIFPLLFVYASGILAVGFRTKPRFDPDEYKVGGKPVKRKELNVKNLALQTAIGALAAFMIFSPLHEAPYYISYMNEFAGGHQRRAWLLSDSNLDWGQGLPALEKWTQKHGIKTVRLFYRNLSDNPALYDFNYILKDPLELNPDEFIEGEVYAISMWTVADMNLTYGFFDNEEDWRAAEARYADIVSRRPDEVIANGAIWIFAP